MAVASFDLDVGWLARCAEPKRDTGGGASSRLRLPFLLPYNSLERQVRLNNGLRLQGFGRFAPPLVGSDF